jgi:hypothetical protein
MAEFNIFGGDESFVSSLKEFFKKHGHDVRFHTSASHPDGHLDMSLPLMAKDYPTLSELEREYGWVTDETEDLSSEVEPEES